MEIHEKCPEEYTTLIMRRFMMRIAEKVARQENSEALITGESVGQVASQTMTALGTTDMVVDMPVFRPLIGFDKEEIIAVSEKSARSRRPACPTRTAARSSRRAIPRRTRRWRKFLKARASSTSTG